VQHRDGRGAAGPQLDRVVDRVRRLPSLRPRDDADRDDADRSRAPGVLDEVAEGVGAAVGIRRVLDPGGTAADLDRAADVEASKVQLRKILLDRKEKQPVEYPTAGCMFVNWKPESPEQLEGLRRTLDLNGDEKIPLTPQGTVPAGWIVDRAQLKGTKVGHVEVSAKHGNFFITDGKASSDEVVQLTAVLKTRVRNITDGVVQLHEEVEYVGF